MPESVSIRQSDSRWLRLAHLTSLFGFFALGLAWLLPNKSFPWLSAWNEGLAFAASVLLGLATAMSAFGGSRKERIAWPMYAIVIFGILTVWLQWFFGLLVFRGDAVLATLYLGCYWLAMSAGNHFAQDSDGAAWIDGLLSVTVVAGLISFGCALNQWTRANGLVLWIQEIGAYGRPYANLGQTNHLNTLLFIAGCMLLQLHARDKVRSAVLYAGLAALSFGMALTQSRTAIVQIFALLLWSVWQYRSLRPNKNTAVVFCVLYVGSAFLLPHLSTWALLSTGRPIELEATTGDLRFTAWVAMLDAASQHPWQGYGWLQNSWAQQLVAEQHPGLRYEFNYSHNFIIDLMLWVGIPAALLLVGMLLYWGLAHIKSRNTSTVYIMGAIAGIFIHGLLEYPLSYAYFLIPLGLFIGIVDAIDPALKKTAAPPIIIGIVSVMLWALLTIAGREYVQAVETDSIMRTEALRIGVAKKTTPPPDFPVLDQLGAQFAFRFIDPVPNMNPEDLLLMKKVAKRYGNYAVLTDYAYAAGLNGESAEKEHYLNVVCAIYGEKRCMRDMDEWESRRLLTGGRLDIYFNKPQNPSATHRGQ